MDLLSSNRCFGGEQRRYKVYSECLKGETIFALYLPPEWNERTPILYWLSGLTCTDENFVQKAGAQRIAAELGMAIVAPDTSPRGTGVADADRYDLGQGAGFYVNATAAPWQSHYQMESLLIDELPSWLKSLGLQGPASIAGHSMGGHGALVLAQRHPERFQSVSAFSPICEPTACQWGRDAFSAYLGADETAWQPYDASYLLRTTQAPWPIRVDVGLSDQFLTEQLRIESLEAAATASGSALKVHRHEGYDHSYFFIATFIEDQLRFHARHLAE